MNRKNSIVNLLVLILGFQAVWASADVHQWHKGESDHQAVMEHQHQDVKLTGVNEDLIESHDHHCCHCMSCHLTFLVPTLVNSDFLPNTIIRYCQLNQHEAPLLAITLRPPIV